MDQPIFNVVYQELVTWNGSDYFHVVPMLATNWTVSPDYKHYIFTLRQGVYFTDGEPFNATVVWFSLYRTIIMGQGPGVSNYGSLLFHESVYSETGYATPWGVCRAMEQIFGLQFPNPQTNLTGYEEECANALANVLSNFNVHNQSIVKLMEYPNQAVVVLGPYEVEINLIHPYMYFLLDIASWWGAMVPPAYVDAHGGVQVNSPNSYLCQYGLPGTGPYEIQSVTGTPGEFTEIVLTLNPNYWGNNYPPGSLPVLDQPGHIKIIDLKISESHTNRVELFAENQAQLSYVSSPFLSQVYSAWSPYNQYLPPTSIVHISWDLTPECIMMFSMNTQRWPTNITDFRLAIEHAINYTALLYTYYSPLLNVTLAKLYLGPFTPLNPALYNPDNLSFYSYNPNLAIEYLNESGWEGDFYTVLPNGTVIGNPNGQKLPSIPIYVIPPVTPQLEEQLEIVSQDLSQIGIPTAISYVTSSEFDSWTSPSISGRLIYEVGWCADWPDPIMQIAISILTGELPTGDYAWYNNPTVANLLYEAAFTTNLTEQIQIAKQVYEIVYNQAPYVWIPDPVPYFLVQPYVKGVIVTWTVLLQHNVLQANNDNGHNIQ
ncbi:ABC transporter substrate-binding protein [Vulcanisaeta sp. JCM 14467]|uniref:ABC transporter substrate-binding protein n=1 Tax=Vulcanisaeta sp. JCM 14467 TaxID=1295370 RepID=UPI0006D102CA|nr:ABC transporter substrate-binding protein [Vulcanisaeta sp. JCM 14467]